MTPDTGRIEGAAFPPLVKAAAAGLVAAMLAWGLRVADELLAVDWTFGAAAVVVLAIAMVLWCTGWILRSRTSVDAARIRQTWMWDKQVDVADITQARLVGVPGLAWLVAPRLVVRARGRGLLVFHAADPRVLAAFARLCLGSLPVAPMQAPTRQPPASAP